MARCGRRKYPQIAYIDRNLYYKTDRICEMVPRRMPDGVINTFVPREIMPDGGGFGQLRPEREIS